MFAVTFGYGRVFLKPGVYEERFGLRVVANVIDPEHIRSINKKDMSIVPKLATEQVVKSGTVADFGLDIEQDLLQGMTGKSKVEEFGNTVTGKDALSVSVKVNYLNIKDFLNLCYEKYRSEDYKEHFDWIDNIAEIKSPIIVENLNSKLIDKIKNTDLGKVWMAIPNIIPWENVAEFRIRSDSHTLGDDINLPDFINLLSEEERTNLSLDILKRKVIECIGIENDEIIDHWKAYDCLYGEVSDGEKTYILSGGKWYEVENDFASQVNNEFTIARDVDPVLVLPKCKRNEHEPNYKERVAEEISSICNMDRKTVNHGSSYSKIEFCDLISSDKVIIHVKHYGASSVLSHLFSQGVVSGELFLSDSGFRAKVREKLIDSHKVLVPDLRPLPSEYTIIFAIISKSDDILEIPFFSKVNLRNAMKRLKNTLNYNVSLLTIPTENT